MNNIFKNIIAILISIVFILTGIILVLKSNGNVVSYLLNNNTTEEDIEPEFIKNETIDTDPYLSDKNLNIINETIENKEFNNNTSNENNNESKSQIIDNVTNTDTAPNNNTSTIKEYVYNKTFVDPKNPGIMRVIDGNYDKTYFKNTLFIGDSRVEGLKLYSNAPDAHYFCSTGMDEFKIFKDPLYVDGVGLIYLEFLLTDHKYDKIFLQLGINSLGYGFQNHLDHYKEVVNKISLINPNAKLYLVSNMHVATYKNSESKYINNKTIDRFEVEVKKLADDEHIFYIDINRFMDDDTGGLNPAFTNDGVHLVPKYYDVIMDVFYNLTR